MKVHIAWPITFALIAIGVLGILLHEKSWITDYAEAEPLYPTVAEFGRALADKQTDETVSAADIKSSFLEERFNMIHKYGVVFSDNQDVLVTIRINDIFSFDIPPDGNPKWNKR